MIIGLDAKRIVRNGTGLGSYGRTLVNDLIRMGDSHLSLRLYAPDEGRDELRGQIIGDGRTESRLYPPSNSISDCGSDAWGDSVQGQHHGLQTNRTTSLFADSVLRIIRLVDILMDICPQFLKPGDVVECEIEGIGVLRNYIED